mmetsp:Transcript_5566/g.11719  ORF Transcript_5566/g.11719 Transcript_5566/m.11719 type:complete len:205 (+) Transcript_5566:157-771(+)
MARASEVVRPHGIPTRRSLTRMIPRESRRLSIRRPRLKITCDRAEVVVAVRPQHQRLARLLPRRRQHRPPQQVVVVCLSSRSTWPAVAAPLARLRLRRPLQQLRQRLAVVACRSSKNTWHSVVVVPLRLRLRRRTRRLRRPRLILLQPLLPQAVAMVARASVAVKPRVTRIRPTLIRTTRKASRRQSTRRLPSKSTCARVSSKH